MVLLGSNIFNRKDIQFIFNPAALPEGSPRGLSNEGSLCLPVSWGQLLPARLGSREKDTVSRGSALKRGLTVDTRSTFFCGVIFYLFLKIKWCYSTFRRMWMPWTLRPSALFAAMSQEPGPHLARSGSRRQVAATREKGLVVFTAENLSFRFPSFLPLPPSLSSFFPSLSPFFFFWLLLNKCPSVLHNSPVSSMLALVSAAHFTLWFPKVKSRIAQLTL